jgi:predicted kinase
VRWAVIVNGPPGSGKTTTARSLAAVLQVPLFSKDAVKETLLDELGYRSREESRAIGAASGEVLWTLLRDCPGPAVVESWLAPHMRDIVRAGLRRAEVERVIEVWCSCPFDEIRRRYAERERHPGHFDSALLPELDEVLRTAQPLALGAVLRVETDRELDVMAVARAVLSAASEPMQT